MVAVATVQPRLVLLQLVHRPILIQAVAVIIYNLVLQTEVVAVVPKPTVMAPAVLV
jgi:hypothetical protein